MDGIISLEMTPDWQSPDVRTRLATCLTKASSLIIRMADSSSLFSGAVQYLEEIKRICQPFDLSRVEFYKQLQRKQAEDTVAAIEIEAADADLLQGLAVTVFGTDPEELKQVGALRD